MEKKIKINFTVTIDIDAYMEEYGLTLQEACDAIKEHIQVAGIAELIQNGFIKQMAEVKQIA